MHHQNERPAILVTGGAGFIGSHTCKALYHSGYLPIVVDSLTTGHKDAVKWGPLFQIDLRNAQDLNHVFKTTQPKAVIHFAASAYVGESNLNPKKYYENNVITTLQLLSTMIENECYQIINSSSCATYGQPNSIPISINAKQSPINPYGRTKLIIEQILTDFQSAHHLTSLSLRYFNAAGSDPDGELGEQHVPETHIIPLLLEAALSPEKTFSIFGTDYDTPDGTCIRDYVHVSDLANAHVLGLQYLSTRKNAHFLNLGTGRGHSIREVIQVVEEVTHKKIKTTICPRRPGDPSTLVADPGSTFDLLKWKPQYPDLHSQVQHAWNWVQHRAKN